MSSRGQWLRQRDCVEKLVTSSREYLHVVCCCRCCSWSSWDIFSWCISASWWRDLQTWVCRDNRCIFRSLRQCKSCTSRMTRPSFQSRWVCSTDAEEDQPHPTSLQESTDCWTNSNDCCCHSSLRPKSQCPRHCRRSQSMRLPAPTSSLRILQLSPFRHHHP